MEGRLRLSICVQYNFKLHVWSSVCFRAQPKTPWWVCICVCLFRSWSQILIVKAQVSQTPRRKTWGQQCRRGQQSVRPGLLVLRMTSAATRTNSFANCKIPPSLTQVLFWNLSYDCNSCCLPNQNCSSHQIEIGEHLEDPSTPRPNGEILQKTAKVSVSAISFAIFFTRPPF